MLMTPLPALEPRLNGAAASGTVVLTAIVSTSLGMILAS